MTTKMELITKNTTMELEKMQKQHDKILIENEEMFKEKTLVKQNNISPRKLMLRAAAVMYKNRKLYHNDPHAIDGGSTCLYNIISGWAQLQILGTIDKKENLW